MNFSRSSCACALCCLLHSAVLVLGDAVDCDADGFCSLVNQSIQTPTNNSRIRTSCTYSNQNQSGLICSSVSFFVIAGADETIEFSASSNLFADSSRTCLTPSFFGTSTCGKGVPRLISDSYGKSFKAVPFAVKPSPNIPQKYFGQSSTTVVCFRFSGSVNQRCIYIFINIAPSAPSESTTQKFDFAVNIGYELTMTLTSSQIVETDQTDISLSVDSPELPGSVWTSETFCVGSAMSAFNGRCPFFGTDNWGRILIYKPRPQENGNLYTIYIQATSVGYPPQPQGLFPFICAGIHEQYL